jgi:hypothetical protein
MIPVSHMIDGQQGFLRAVFVWRIAQSLLQEVSFQELLQPVGLWCDKSVHLIPVTRIF